MIPRRQQISECPVTISPQVYSPVLFVAFCCPEKKEDSTRRGITARIPCALSDTRPVARFLISDAMGDWPVRVEFRQLLDQGNSLPQLEEGLRLLLKDNEKLTSHLEELKGHERLLQEKVDKRVEEERRLKVRVGGRAGGRVVSRARACMWCCSSQQGRGSGATRCRSGWLAAYRRGGGRGGGREARRRRERERFVLRLRWGSRVFLLWAVGGARSARVTDARACRLFFLSSLLFVCRGSSRQEPLPLLM